MPVHDILGEAKPAFHFYQDAFPRLADGLQQRAGRCYPQIGTTMSLICAYFGKIGADVMTIDKTCDSSQSEAVVQQRYLVICTIDMQTEQAAQ